MNRLKEFRHRLGEVPEGTTERARVLLLLEIESASRSRHPRVSSRTVLKGALATALVVVGGTAILTPAGATVKSSLVSLFGSSEPHPAFVASDVPLDRFSAVSKGDERPVDELPFVLRSAVASTLGTADAEASLKVSEVQTGPHESAILAGNEQGLCLAQTNRGDASAGCSPLDDAYGGSLFVIAKCEPGMDADQVKVVGAAPDEVVKVVISSSADGRKSQGTVRANTFSIEAESQESDLRGLREDGSTAFVHHLDQSLIGLGPDAQCAR